MRNPQQEPMGVARFLEWPMSRPDGERWELSGGLPLRMAAEENRHNLLETAVAVRLQSAIDAAGSDCRLSGDGVAIVVDDGYAYEPDAAVQCGGSIDLGATTIDAPVIVVEVLSPSTAYRDTGEKLAGYLGLPPTGLALDLDACFAALSEQG